MINSAGRRTTGLSKELSVPQNYLVYTIFYIMENL